MLWKLHLHEYIFFKALLQDRVAASKAPTASKVRNPNKMENFQLSHRVGSSRAPLLKFLEFFPTEASRTFIQSEFRSCGRGGSDTKFASDSSSIGKDKRNQSPKAPAASSEKSFKAEKNIIFAADDFDIQSFVIQQARSSVLAMCHDMNRQEFANSPSVQFRHPGRRVVQGFSSGCKPFIGCTSVSVASSTATLVSLSILLVSRIVLQRCYSGLPRAFLSRLLRLQPLLGIACGENTAALGNCLKD